jgi:acetyl esterase/lipase
LQQVPFPISHADLVYKHLENAGVDLLMDEYDPEGVEGELFPAVILVHGGGGVGGCKEDENAHAYDLSANPRGRFAQRFLAFAIDYRLACSSADPAVQGTDQVAYCDWPFSRTDPDGFDGDETGPAIHDIEWAVDYVRLHANDYCNCWNGKIWLAGGSWGGGLVFMAAWRLQAIGSEDQVQAVSAWSGSLEIQQQSDGRWPCAPGQTRDVAVCQWHNNEYLGCSIELYPDPICLSPTDRYADASAIGRFGAGGPTGWPRAFFSNAGTDPDHPELHSYQSSEDFRDWLATTWTEGVDFEFCSVDNDLHAEEYIYNSSCEGETENVFQSTVNFLLPALG